MTQFYGTLTPEKTEREEKNMQLVRKGAGECMVLLENDGVLPLKKIGKIALYGAGARHTIKGGTGSGDVNSREVINIEQGLKDDKINSIVIKQNEEVPTGTVTILLKDGTP